MKSYFPPKFFSAALLIPFCLSSLAFAQITRGTAASGFQRNGLTVSASFTAPANSLVFACVMVDNGATPSHVTTITPALGWSKIGPTLMLSQTAALELWAGYTSTALAAQSVTVNYATASNAQDSSLVLQSYSNTASTSAQPLAGIGPNVGTSALNANSPVNATVTASGHSNSLYIGCGGLDNETSSSFSSGAGFVTDAVLNNGVYVTSAIETASATTSLPANTVVSFTHPPGRDGYLFGVELIDVAYGGGGSNPPPSITFSASPASITSGQTSTLSWSTANANSVSIDNGIGSVASSGSLIVSPSATTTYTMTATGAGGTLTSTTTLTVSATTPPPTATFTANPTSITTGQSSSLSWTSTNATSLSIDNGIGTVAASGSRTVTPSATTTYALTATGAGGTTVSSVTVNVSAPAPNPPTVTLAANPTSIPAGQSSSLSWTSTNATSVSINNGIGAVATSGTLSVAPASTTTYTITATGAGGTSSAAATVNVTPGGGGGTSAPTQTYLNFNGSNVVTIPNTSNIVTGAMTVELWIKPGQNGISKTIASQYVSNTNMQWQLLRDASNRIQFKVRNASGTVATTTSASFAADLLWHHLAAVYNFSNISIYGDGALLVSQSLAGNLSTAAVPLCLASIWTGSVCNNSGAFLGGIDDFRVFNRALSLSEIQSGMNTEIGSTTGLVGYWKLDEGATSQTAADSGSGAHGAILGRTTSVETYDPVWLPDTVAPNVAVTSPANGASVSGIVTLSATASDNTGIASVQFAVDGTNVGTLLTSAPYSMSFNANSLPAGSHIFSATARDAAGNSSASSTAATVVADTTPPVVSNVATSLVTSASASVGWTTNEGASSQVAYGPTISYGSTTTLDPNFVLQHSQVLTGLTPATLYHYSVYSKDAAGNQSVSTDRTFLTSSVSAACSDSNFSFVTFSDNYSGLEGGMDRLLTEISGFDPNIRFLAGTGDTTSFQRVRGIIDADLNPQVNCGASEFPWFPATGNHDQETQSYMDWLASTYATNWTTSPANSRLALQLPTLTNFKRGPLRVLSSATTTTNVSNGSIYSFDYKNAHFLFINNYEQGVTRDDDAGAWDINGPSVFDPTNSQLDWIEQDLQSTTQPVTFVLSHVGLVAPVYSNSNPPPLWSDHNSVFHTQDLAAILARHNNVKAIYRGHDHAPSRELIDGTNAAIFKRDYWDVANDPNGATGTPSQWQTLQGPGRIWQVDSGSVYTNAGAYVITKVSSTQVTFLIYQWSNINPGTTQLWDIWTVPIN